MADLMMSRLYEPNAKNCCEACVFGRGDHATWCQARITAWMAMHLASADRLAAIRLP